VVNEGLFSYGDRLETGFYELHSRFGKAVNYRLKNRIVSLVSKGVGGGPNNIVFQDSLSFETPWLEIADNSVRGVSGTVELEREKRYSSRVQFSAVERGIFMARLDILKRHVISASPPRSLSYLLVEECDAPKDSEFDEAVRGRIREGWACLKGGDYERSASLLTGTGYGLTPAGDDFISGYLSGLFIDERLFGVNHTAIRRSIFSCSRKTNVLSLNYIRFAYEGCFYERAKRLLSAIMGRGFENLEVLSNEMISIGETSGTDFAVGLLCAFSSKDGHS
jgi:hypothetical protein